MCQERESMGLVSRNNELRIRLEALQQQSQLQNAFVSAGTATDIATGTGPTLVPSETTSVLLLVHNQLCCYLWFLEMSSVIYLFIYNMYFYLFFYIVLVYVFLYVYIFARYFLGE